MKRLALFAILACLPLSVAVAFDGGGVPPSPTKRDCKLDATGNCTILSADCDLLGGYCLMGPNSSSRWHDGEMWPIDNCGCMI